MKKLLTVLLVLLFTVSMFGCEKKTGEDENKTMGAVLLAQFEEEVKKSTDCMTIINNLSQNEVVEFMVDVREVEAGYMNGFDDEVTGFTKGATFGPMMSQPFVCYVFEVENPAEFLEKLKSQANPRWNICTEAQETVYTTSGNLVFFAMCPGAED